jgi:hypothetical protein
MAGVTKEDNRAAAGNAEKKTARDIDITSTPSVRAGSSTTPGAGAGAAANTNESARGQEGDSGFMDRMRERAGQQLTNQKNRATDGIGTIADAVRNTTQELRQHQHETLAEYVTSAADQLDRLSSRLKDKDIGDLLRDAQNLARRQPVLFIGSAFALGLLGARFLKSSPPSQTRDWRDHSSGAGSGAYRGTSAYEGRVTADPTQANPGRASVTTPGAPGTASGPRTGTPYGDR